MTALPLLSRNQVSRFSPSLTQIATLLVMCGRYTLTNPSDLAARFGLEVLTETRLEPRFNIAPAQLAPIIVEDEEGRSLEWMRWGYKPAWMKGFRPGRPVLRTPWTVIGSLKGLVSPCRGSDKPPRVGISGLQLKTR